eukprot:TRINITY_DN11474_c1_g4_i1.p1 TRINITY_DN11474_c1_g4~~TRINITY_DN11474_c1_g4_i1.p1  ORF type:complete len:485 (+),score=59.80 TRINITY_DN11474_c1_g4_i1:54-1508(+)
MIPVVAFSLPGARRRLGASRTKLLKCCSILALVVALASASRFANATRRPGEADDNELAAGWLARIQATHLFTIVGCLLAICAMTSLFPAESRYARMRILARIGEGECTTVSPNLSNTEKRGHLVHICGAIARAIGPVHDNRFKEIRCTKGVLMVRTTVEAYQWVEKGTASAPTYVKMWCAERVDSNHFQSKGFENKLPVEGLDLGAETSMCETVTLGACYSLPATLMAKCRRWRAISAPFDVLHFDDYEFHKQGEYYYHRDNQEAEANMIGDTRVKIELVPNQSVTVLALQGPPGQSNSEEMLLPYRFVSDDSCSPLDGEEKRALRISLGMNATCGINVAQRCECGFMHALFFTCCRSCNSGPPEVFDIMPYAVTLSDMWSTMLAMKLPCIWKRRFFCWAWLFVSLLWVFQPTEGYQSLFARPHTPQDLAAIFMTIIFTHLIASLAVVLPFTYHSISRGLVCAVQLGCLWCLTTYLLSLFWMQR